MGQPIAYNSSGGVSGSIQAGKLSYAVETSGRDYTSYLSKKWVSSVEPKTGSYVFVTDSFTQGKTTEGNAYPLFYSTESTSSADVVAVVNGLPGITASFTTANEALDAVAASGEYLILDAKEPYEDIDTDGLVWYVDASKLSSYPETGSKAYDLSNRNTDPTLNEDLGLKNGVGFSDHNAFVFDRVDDYGTVSNFNRDNKVPLSIFALIKQTDDGASYAGIRLSWIIGKRDNGNDRQFQILTRRDTNSDGIRRFEVDVYSGSTGDGVSNTTGQEIELNRWYHVGFTTDGTSGSLLNTIVNGNTDFSSSLPFNRGTGSREVVVGTTPWVKPGSLLWGGEIQHWAIYDKALTQTQINQNYYGGNIVTDGLVFALDASKLVSYESGSTTAYSMTGSASGSLINGVGFDKENGGSWVFDGVDDYVNCGNDSSVQITGELTQEAWFKASSNSNNQGIIYKDNQSSRCYKLQLQENTNKLWPIYFSSSVAYNTFTGSTDVGDNEWHHGVAVFDPGNSIAIYLDGQLEVTYTSGIPNSLDNDPADLELGRKGNGTLYLNGKISVAKIYNRALTEEEVAQNYNATKQRYVK